MPVLAKETASTPDARLHPRFDRLARLYGENAVARLAQARVVVFGVGGVGSFAAEALARSGIGHIMLVDHDEVCVTNANRQMQALAGAVGKPKAELMRDRLRLINPDAQIEAHQAFYCAGDADRLLTPPWPGCGPAYDFVLDCIDNLTAKAHLIATCRRRGIPIVSAMGAGGKIDPTRIRAADLGRTDVCPLAHQLRRILRRNHDFPGGRKLMGVLAVYSDEPRHWPQALTQESCEAHHEGCPRRGSRRAADNQRHLIDGTAVFVTGAFGLACAAQAVNALTGIQDRSMSSEPAPEGDAAAQGSDEAACELADEALELGR